MALATRSRDFRERLNLKTKKLKQLKVLCMGHDQLKDRLDGSRRVTLRNREFLHQISPTYTLEGGGRWSSRKEVGTGRPQMMPT